LTAMHIGVNVLWLRPGEVGGSESYARRVLRSLANHEPDLQLHLFGTASGIGVVRPDGAPVEEYITAATSLKPRRRVVVERTWLRSVVGPPLDVLHHPSGTVPFTNDTPALVTIHDLQPLEDPSNFSATKRLFLAKAIPAAIDRAAVVTTPSDWVRSEVIDRFDVDPDRVVTVSAFAETRDLSQSTNPSPRLAKIFTRGPVLFFPAMTLGHKNHAMLFEAFRRAVRQEPDLQLACVGSVGRDHGELIELARSVSPSIHMLGHVAGSDLDALFRMSEVLVFPSKYEGFGLPVIEAQNAELPVIASNATALPEVAGDAAILLDPNDIDAWASAMQNRLTPTERAKHVAAGIQNAARYSSELTAKQQRSAYDRCSA